MDKKIVIVNVESPQEVMKKKNEELIRDQEKPNKKIINYDDLIDLQQIKQLPCSIITPDQQIIKYLESQGQEPEEPIQSLANINYKIAIYDNEGKLKNKDKYKQQQKIKLEDKQSDKMEGLHIALKSMQPKEVSWFQIGEKYQKQYNLNQNDKTQQNAEIKDNSKEEQKVNDQQIKYYKLEFIKFENTQQKIPKCFQDILEPVLKNKNLAKQEFQNDKFQEAIKLYTKSFNLTQGIPGTIQKIMTDLEKQELVNTQGAIQKNLCICYRKLKQIDKACIHAKNAYDLIPKDIQTLYLYADSLFMNNDFDNAAKMLKEYINDPKSYSDPQNRSQCIDNLKYCDKQKNKKQQSKLFEKMLDPQANEQEEIRERHEKIRRKKEEELQNQQKQQQKQMFNEELEHGTIMDKDLIDKKLGQYYSKQSDK